VRRPGSGARRRTRTLLAVLMIIAATAIPTPVWAALNASVADLTLAAVPYSHADQTTSGSLTLTAQDTGREQCILLVCSTVNDGWNVTLQASAFIYSGPHNGTAIPAANLVITTAHPPTRVSGQQISATGGPRTTNVTGALDVARKTLQADGPSGGLTPTYYGIGTYQQAIDVSLAVPGGSRAGTYTTTLTVTMSAGP
jgi:hypothetical protein